MQTLDEILQHAASAIQAAADLKSLDQFRVNYLGKKGQLTEYLKTLGQLPPEERPAAGQKINIAKEHIQALIEKRTTELQHILIEKQLASEKIDISLPGRSQGTGNTHPITKTF